MKKHFEPLESDPFRWSDLVIVIVGVVGVIVVFVDVAGLTGLVCRLWG
jgi:hypothetical protein